MGTVPRPPLKRRPQPPGVGITLAQLPPSSESSHPFAVCGPGSTSRALPCAPPGRWQALWDAWCTLPDLAAGKTDATTTPFAAANGGDEIFQYYKKHPESGAQFK